MSTMITPAHVAEQIRVCLGISFNSFAVAEVATAVPENYIK